MRETSWTMNESTSWTCTTDGSILTTEMLKVREVTWGGRGGGEREIERERERETHTHTHTDTEIQWVGTTNTFYHFRTYCYFGTHFYSCNKKKD